MSQRGKRGNHLHHPRLDVEPQPPPTKRRKGRPPNGGGGGLGGGLGGGGGSGGGPGNNINFPGTQQNVNCIRTLVTSSTTSVELEPNQHTAVAAVAGDEIISSTSAKAAGSQGSSSSVATWQARSVSDIKMSSIYNRSSTEAPAELYRKDLISAMKLPDSEQLANYEYLVVNDQWKQEWERGVQVPVNPDSLPEPYVEVLTEPIVPPAHDFKLPKNRFLRITKDDNYSPELHYLTNVVALAENSCAYDIDQVDEAWLKLYNSDRKQYGAFSISETQFERVIEELEIRCWEQIQVILKNEEGLGIEYDENVICDVCRSPDSEEANEMVFCDNCNICVHQACYGITAIPSGQWLCRTCSMGIKPDCVLCPNKGGAMKSTKSGKHWAHVSCALWIPEVSIGCVDRMEPITKISSIPTSRWALLCVLCRGRDGACIQCSVKTCKTAYHVTCAFQHGLEMRAIIEEGNAEDGVKLRSYCHKHSVSKGKKEANSKAAVSSSTSCKNRLGTGIGSGTEDDDCRRRKSRKSDMTSEERNQVRARRLQEVESEFDKHVNIKDISCHLFDVDDEAVEAIYNYWKLKRKSRNNRALIPPKSEDVEMIARKQEQQDLENHKLVVHLRQDLERVRNLCYMVSRREKLSRSLFKLREQVFYKQISVLTDSNAQSSSESNEKCDEQFKNAVIYANDGPTLYDRFYSSGDRNTTTQYQSLEYILEKLLGSAKNGPKAGTKTSRASTSPTKRAIKSTAATSSASTSANNTSNSAGKSNKKVNNGGVISSKTSSLISAVSENTDKQLTRKSATRRSATSAATPALTTPTSSGHRTSASRTSSKAATATTTPTATSKTTKNTPNSSDDSSSSSGSSSSDDEDSSSDNGSSSGSASSSDTESGSSSSDSDSSSLSGSKVNSPRINKNLKKVSTSKKKVGARSIETAAKQRRKSIIQTQKTETETKTTTSTKSTKEFSKSEITTVLSSSSELEAEANKKKQKVSVPVKQSSNNNTSETEAGVTKSTAHNTTNLLLSQMETTNKTSLVKDNSSSSSDESIEVTPKKCRKQLTKSMEVGSKDYQSRKKLNEPLVNRKIIEQIYSDSDSSSELNNKEKEERAAESNVSDSQNQQTIRTKAAMKEFTLQQQTCSKTQKDMPVGGSLEKSKEISASSHKLSNDLIPPKPQKLSSDLLVVPQRQAAKKASENMRSTNLNTLTGIATLSTFSNTSNTGTLQRDVELKHREATKQKESATGKFEEKTEKKNSSSKNNEQQLEKPIVNKRGRPPKNIKETVEPSQPTSSTTTSEQTIGIPTRAKELQSPSDQESKKANASITTAQTSEEKLTQNRLTSATTDSSKSNEVAKNNILVAYVVPQRQAAKKAAEQLKNSNKTLQTNVENNVTPTTNMADVDKDKERINSSIEKESKLKTPEDRSAKSVAPTRRMSTRESTISANKQDTSTIATAGAKKTPTSSRQRSKDEPPVQTPITTTPKRGAQSLDKKRKVSVTSSSESDSSSSSSSSDGSDDSSSNSGSSYTSSSSDEDASDIEEKTTVECAIPDATKQNVRKSLDSRTMISQQNSGRDTKISPKLPSPKQLKRNVSNSSNSTEEHNSIRSSIQTRRQSSLLDEQQLQQKAVASKITSDSQVEDNSTSIPQSSSLSPKQTPIPTTITTTLNKQLPNEEQDEPKNEIIEVDVNVNDDANKNKNCSLDKERGLHQTTATTSAIQMPPEISQEPNERMDVKNKISTTNDLKENSRSNVNLSIMEKHKDEDNTKENFDTKETSIAHSHSDSITTVEDKPALHSVDVCSEVPMDIDEELTAAPTHTSLPSADNSALLKTDELLVDLDPPAAPVPASPTASSSSSCEENDDQSNASNEDQEHVESTRCIKSRRTIPASPPISAEEEHTHHTQHLLNEMDLIKALEEERKKELAASQAEEIKFAESKSPGVAVIVQEPLEIIDLDSNSNSEHTTTPPKQPLDVPTTLQMDTTQLEISPLTYGKSALEVNKNQQNIDSLQQETKLHSSIAVLPTTSPSTPKVSCEPLPLNTQTSVLESGHHPIVDTILDLEDNAKKKQEENQQQHIHSFPNVLLNTSPFDSHVLDPHQESLNNLLTSDKTEEDSFQATRNLLEKLRKKRNRTDEPKEPDLMLPPPTPAIPSVFPFHNAADPEDIIHAQKENAALSSLEANSAGHYNLDSSQPSQTTQQQATNNHNLLVGSSPNTATVTPNKDNNLDIYGNMPHNNSADAARSTADPDNICSMSLSTYIEGNGQTMQTPHSQQSQPQLPISPMQQHSAQHTPTQHHTNQGTTPNSNYSQQQPHTPAQQQTNVAELTSLIQNELASQANSSALNKTPTIDAFGPKQNNMSSNDVASDRVASATPDFVDLHAAAAASKDFTSSASMGSNKLVVDCDFDENTRMQSPYTMQANRIWNENDLIAARRSTSPSSVSESNDQTPSIDLQPQQQTTVQHQIPLQQGSHVQSQQHTNVLNSNSDANNSNTISKNSFFNSINNFALTSPFQQHGLQSQNQLSQQTQQQQQSSITNGIDSMIYNQSYNSSAATTPTSQGTPQQQSNVQQQQQQARTQYNGSVGLFHDAASTLPNMNQIPFVSNDGSSGTTASVMYPAGPGIGTNVNTGSNTSNPQTRPDLYNSNSTIGSTNSAGVPYSGAAFTSSTHNIALTAAIVGVSATGSLIDHNSPRHPQMRPSHQFSLTSPNNANAGSTFNSMHLGSCAESMMSNPQQTTHHTTPTKDSPSKANRSSSRYNQQTQQQQQLRSTHKSPQVAQHKSPGKSPRQMELLNKQLQQQQQQQHGNLSEYPTLSSKPTKYDPLTHTLAGKPRQRAPRGTGSGTRGRGRGRGRNRGCSVPNALIPLPIPMSEYVSADNLVGTPFEFSYEEEMASPGMENLQSLRDRRRSFDCRNAQNSDGLKYRSPSYNAGACKVRHSAAGSTSSVTSVTATTTGTNSIVNCNNNLKGTTSNLHSIVQPMLPGPVDMRTYNLGFEPQHSSASQEAYNNNLLGAFDSGTADQTLSEFDEEDEREFQSALRATGTTSSISTTKQLQMSLTSSITNTSSLGTASTGDSASSATNNNLQIQTYSETTATSTTVAGISNSNTSTSANIDIKSMSVAVTTKTCHQTAALTTAISSAELVTDLQTSMETTSEDVSIDSDTILTTKASLSDARNQLKLKIKGPLAYPDSYNSSNAITHTSTTVQSNISNVQSMASTNATISASVSGSGTNSRRMRKKELLSLYVVQKDNHGDDSSCGLPSTDSNLLSNALETTRKPESVCSEVDEYGSEFNASNKRFKKNSSRELRSLDIMVGDINDTTGLNLGADGRRRSGCSSGSAENSVAKIGAASSAGKRRGRSKTLEGAEDEPAPKLKIKIRGLTEGNVSATATVGSCETSFNNYEVARRSVACPPKKRLTSNYTPTLEDLMRDSMNYRDQVMQEFGGDDDERTKRSTGFNSTSLLCDPPVHVKKMKSSKSKKEKKDKKRHKNKDFEDNVGSINAVKSNNSMITTLIEQPTSASPGEPPKLILRINKRKAESTATDTSRSSPATANTALSPEGPSAPIRLKLARVAEGGGYVIGDKKRKKGKKSSSVTNTDDLANANSNTSCSNAVTTPVSVNNMEKFNEDANARLGMSTSPTVATFSNYAGGDVVGVAEPPSMAETVSDVAKDSSTPSPCLVIDSSKSNDLHDSSNTASSLNDITAPCITESIHSLAVTPTATLVSRNCNENSNSQSSSALSSHSRLSNSNSNSMLSATHQSQTSTGNSSSNTTNQNNQHTNTNNSNSNSNSNSGNNSGSSSILVLQKNCEVR